MKYKKYPSYKDSGVEWLGEIPEHWETSRLKFLCNITTGGKDTENKVDDGKYPFYVRSQTIEKINSYSFDGEAILTAGDGVGVGKVFHYTSGKFDFHQRVYMFYSFKKILGIFLFEYIKNNFYNVALAGVAKSTVDSLRLPLIQNFMITVPNFQEQQNIANYLDIATTKIDTLIQKQTKLIELLKEKRQAVISTAVTRGLDSSVAMKDSVVEWLGEIPEHWKVVGFKRYFKSIVDYRGKTPEKVEKGIFLVTARNIKKGVINYDASSEYVKVEDYDAIMSRGRPEISDVLFTTEAPLGEVANIDNTNVALAQRVIKFSGQDAILDNYYLKYFIMSLPFQNSLMLFATGSTALGIKAERLVYLRKLIPPYGEQQAIANYLDKATAKMDTLITKSTKAIELLKEKRTALISSVVTGKIDVRKNI